MLRQIYAIRFLNGKYHTKANGSLYLFNEKEIHYALKYFRNTGETVTFEKVVK